MNNQANPVNVLTAAVNPASDVVAVIKEETARPVTSCKAKGGNSSEASYIGKDEALTVSKAEGLLLDEFEALVNANVSRVVSLFLLPLMRKHSELSSRIVSGGDARAWSMMRANARKFQSPTTLAGMRKALAAFRGECIAAAKAMEEVRDAKAARIKHLSNMLAMLDECGGQILPAYQEYKTELETLQGKAKQETKEETTTTNA